MFSQSNTQTQKILNFISANEVNTACQYLTDYKEKYDIKVIINIVTDVRLDSKIRNSAFLYLIANAEMDVVTSLFRNFDVNFRDQNGNSALAVVARTNKTKMFIWLYSAMQERGFDVKARTNNDNYNWTDIAISCGNIDMVKLLAFKNRGPEHIDDSSLFPLQISMAIAKLAFNSIIKLTKIYAYECAPSIDPLFLIIKHNQLNLLPTVLEKFLNSIMDNFVNLSSTNNFYIYSDRSDHKHLRSRGEADSLYLELALAYGSPEMFESLLSHFKPVVKDAGKFFIKNISSPYAHQTYNRYGATAEVFFREVSKFLIIPSEDIFLMADRSGKFKNKIVSLSNITNREAQFIKYFYYMQKKYGDNFIEQQIKKLTSLIQFISNYLNTGSKDPLLENYLFSFIKIDFDLYLAIKMKHSPNGFVIPNTRLDLDEDLLYRLKRLRNVIKKAYLMPKLEELFGQVPCNLTEIEKLLSGVQTKSFKAELSAMLLKRVEAECQAKIPNQVAIENILTIMINYLNDTSGYYIVAKKYYDNADCTNAFEYFKLATSASKVHDANFDEARVAMAEMILAGKVILHDNGDVDETASAGVYIKPTAEEFRRRAILAFDYVDDNQHSSAALLRSRIRQIVHGNGSAECRDLGKIDNIPADVISKIDDIYPSAVKRNIVTYGLFCHKEDKATSKKFPGYVFKYC